MVLILDHNKSFAPELSHIFQLLGLYRPLKLLTMD